MRETSPNSLTAGLGFIITGRQRNEIVHDSELTGAEREQFGYLNWARIDEGTDSATFFRRDNDDLHYLGNFMRTQKGGDLARLGWHGYEDISWSAATIVHLDKDDDFVLSALVLS